MTCHPRIGPDAPTAARTPPRTADKPLVVGLAGQPNVGKSTIFNLLTGLSQHVGNWPGKTIERKEGSLAWRGRELRIVDLPGTYSLTANSIEERIARDFILHEQPDVVIMVADAAVLERNLYLLSELLLLPVPVVLGLNMMDVAEREGLRVEPHVLEAALGLPVVPLIARKNQGLSDLLDAALRVLDHPGTFRPARPEIAAPHREVLDAILHLTRPHVPAPCPPEWVALKLLEGDREVTEKTRAWMPPQAWRQVEELLKEHEDAVLDVAGGRYDWIGRMVRAAIQHPPLGQVSFTDRFDRWAVHPLWGLLLLFGALGLVFWVTFNVAAPIQGWLDETVVGTLRAWLRTELAGAPAWAVGLLTDGILGGAGLVVTFLPILLVFFAVLGFLEDTGYLVRTAYVMDRFMHRLGLHGRSFLPLFLGFGCNVPAVFGTRVIESRSGRLLTTLLVPFVPCSARLAVLAFLAPVFFGESAMLAAWGLVAVNLAVLAFAGALFNRLLFRGEHAAFVMELPLYHVPNARTIGRFVWNNIGAFLRNATGPIVLVSIVIWVLSSFPGSDIRHSWLGQFGQMLSLVGELMGMDWRLLVALMSSFVAKENAITALGVLYGAGAEGQGLVDIMTAAVSPATGIAFLVVIMLFVPCLATLTAMRQETRGWGWPILSAFLFLAISLLAGIVTYQALYWLGVGL